jgi:hypothetical protein
VAMKKTLRIAAAVTAGLLLFSVPAFAIVDQYEIVTVEDETFHTYILDTDGGEIWELKHYEDSKGKMNPYFVMIPQFEKDQKLKNWIKKIEDKLNPPPPKKKK